MTERNNPGTIQEHDSRVALADVLERCNGEIVRRWLERMEAQLHRGAGESSKLRDAIPDYLDGLAASLRADEGLEEGGAGVWRTVAREHALTRVRMGFDIEALVRELVILRRVLFEVVDEHGLSMDARQASRVADLVGAAVATAVKSYVDARDYRARREEAERVSFLAHEIKNPLTAVTLALGQLRRTGPLPEQHERVLRVIQRNVDRLLALLGGVLQIGRFQAGKAAPSFSEISLAELFETPVKTAALAAEEKGIGFRADYDPALLVRVDRNLTLSAVRNVLDNAVKFTDHGEVRVTTETTPERVVLHVRDNCPGLSEQELKVIFEPFERGRTIKSGSGLGLAVARRALESEGGEIGAESPGERGCHFWIALPRAMH